jgi:hypothetical protein
MGNSFFSCKGCSEYCVGRTHVEINNNLYGDYTDMNVNKSKTQQRIITNIFIPNCKLEFSPENSNINQNNQLPQIVDNQSKIKNINFDNQNKDKESGIFQNNFTQYFNEAIKNESNTGFKRPSLTYISSSNNHINTKANNNYNIESLNYLNKLRKTPKLIIEDIDNIIKNNIKKIDDKEYIISENTNELIKSNVNLEKIKEELIIQEPVNILKLNDKLKINHFYGNTHITDKIINELVIAKKREIINKYSECFFYPVFIRDIKISFILLLDNNKIKDKIFSNNFNYFFITTFNEKSNRYFGILCFA